MRSQEVMLRAGLVAAVLAGGFLFYPPAGEAQPTPLGDRVAKLRAGLHRVPTADANYQERVKTIVEWGNALASRRLLLAPQDVMSAFYRHPTATPQAVATVERWIRALGFVEDKAGKTGSLVRTDSNQLVAGAYSTVTLLYTVGEVEIPKGEGLRLGQIFISNRPRLQMNDAALDSYVTFKVKSATAATEPYTARWQGVFASIFGPAPAPALRVTSGALKNGDTITITIGDTSGASRGYRPMQRDADDYRFYLEMDPDGDGTFMQAAMTSVKILGDEAALINAVVPSVAAAGESFAVRLRVEDQYLNPARYEGGKFRVLLNRKPVGEIEVGPGKYTGTLAGVKIPQPGAYRFDVASVDGRFACRSNPMLVERNPSQRIYWGELHGHSGWEEGTGSVPRYYEFARDVAFLDFASLTGHDLFLSQPGWDEIRSETAKANQSGSFVAFMGYEWTQTYDKGGHHNIFFKNDKGRYVQYREAPRPDQLYKKLRETDNVDNVLIIPHAHEAGDWNFTDNDMQRLVEIYSGHGSFEYFGLRFLQRGYRMGVIAASDDHSGHPGYAPALVSTRGGLAAVYSPALDRNGIWKGLKDRATYATSGKRPVMKMHIAGAGVGSSIDEGSIPTIDARVLATAGIDHVDVMHNGVAEYSKDYMAPQPGEASAVQIMFFSPSETPGDKVMPPLGAVNWGGWIEVTGGRIQSIEGLGLDSVSDEFKQVDSQRVWFWCRTRGDFDGVLLRLSSAPADTKISVRLSTLDPEAGGTGAGRGIGFTSGAPARTKLHEISFKMSDVATQRGKFDITPAATIFARKATLKETWDASFTYRPTKAPAKNDYYYLRLVQVDGEAAWSSPIWIGK